jgi:hypothetical protein
MAASYIRRTIGGEHPMTHSEDWRKLEFVSPIVGKHGISLTAVLIIPSRKYSSQSEQANNKITMMRQSENSGLPVLGFGVLWFRVEGGCGA